MHSSSPIFQQPSSIFSRSFPSDGSRHSSSSDSKSVLWRPWVLKDSATRRGCRRSNPSLCPYTRLPVSDSTTSAAASPAVANSKLQSFQHPVRLFWPKSKSFDYLYSDGETLLRSFPVQATISFYDESDSDSDEEDENFGEEEDELLEVQKDQCLDDMDVKSGDYVMGVN